MNLRGYLFILVVILFSAINSFGQTQLDVFGGYVLNTNGNEHLSQSRQRLKLKNKYEDSFLLGLKLKKQTGSMFTIDVLFQYEYLKIQSTEFYYEKDGPFTYLIKNPFPHRLFRHNRWSIGTGVGLDLKNGFYLNTNLNGNYTPDIKVSNTSDTFDKMEQHFKVNIHELDLNFLIIIGSSISKDFFLELFYAHEFWTKNIGANQGVFYNTDPRRSLGVKLGYKLATFDKKNRRNRKVDCPKM